MCMKYTNQKRIFCTLLLSPPARGRGLKSDPFGNVDITETVAPHTGAWIEMLMQTIVIEKVLSPPARGRGLKFQCGFPPLG